MNKEAFRKAALSALGLFAIVEGISLAVMLLFPDSIFDRFKFQQWYAHVIVAVLCMIFGASKYWQETRKPKPEAQQEEVENESESD